MFIKQGAVSKRPIAANYGMKFYSTIVLLPTDELEDHFECPNWINNIFTSSYTFLKEQSSNTAYSMVKINHRSMNQAQKWYSRSVFLFVKIHSVPDFGFAGSIWTNAKSS